MICLKNNLPIIELASGQAIAFERDWLIRSLTQAAALAGYSQWWLAHDVAQAVTQFLEEQSATNVLPIETLTATVQSILQVIGYAEIGQHFTPAPPRVQISLLDLAREASTGYELAFFELLGRRLQDLCREPGSYFELLGLESCVKLLRSKKTWSPDCDALRLEIVSFTREQIEIVAIQNPVSFSLA